MARPKRKLRYVVQHVDEHIRTPTKGGYSIRNFTDCRTFRRARAIARVRKGSVEIEQVHLIGNLKGRCRVWALENPLPKGV